MQLIRSTDTALSWRAAAVPVLVAGAAAVTVGYIGLVDPNVAGHYPTCPFLALTGNYCPGCGSLRAVYALAHGDLGRAAGLNLLLVALLPLLAVEWVRWVRARWAGRGQARPAPSWALWATVVVICVFWVVRNLPFGAALAP